MKETGVSNDTRSHSTAAIDLSGRVAVVTGASRA